MPVPELQFLMLLTLQSMSGEEKHASEVRVLIAKAEGVTSDDLPEILPNGQWPLFAYHASWAFTHLENADLTKRVRCEVSWLTEEGKRKLVDLPCNDTNQVEKYPSYVALQTSNLSPSQSNSPDTPGEIFDKAVRYLCEELEAGLLARVRETLPSILERVVIDLLVAISYGGYTAMSCVTVGTGDGGIDGKINEGALGLDVVRDQAKKYAEGNSDFRNFAGAVVAAGTTKGVFATTAEFPRSTKDYVAKSLKRIVLIHSEELTCLMVQYDISARMRDSY